MINVILNGCNGQMGQVMSRLLSAQEGMQVVAGVDKFGELNYAFPVYRNIEDVRESADIVVDFSLPDALPGLLAYAKATGAGLVIATTGLDAEDHTLIAQYTQDIAVFNATNMSLGINLMNQLVQKAVATLGDTFDIELIEMHHNRKVDAPSGTAYTLLNTIQKALDTPREQVYGRLTKTQRRTKEEIGVHSIRGGTITGEHEVLFIGTDEVFSIKHTATSRQIFAYGAISAIAFMQGKKPGFYDMNDLINVQPLTDVYTELEQAFISISNIPANSPLCVDVLQALAQMDIVIDMISQTAPHHGNVTISFTLARADLPKAMDTIRIIDAIAQADITVMEQIAKITVAGQGMERQSGVASKVLGLMVANGISIYAITTAETQIAYVIDQARTQAATQLIQAEFGL